MKVGIYRFFEMGNRSVVFPLNVESSGSCVGETVNFIVVLCKRDDSNNNKLADSRKALVIKTNLDICNLFHSIHSVIHQSDIWIVIYPVLGIKMDTDAFTVIWRIGEKIIVETLE